MARVAALQQQIANKPDASALCLQLAQVYADAGRRDLAAEVVRGLLARDTGNAYLRLRLEQLQRPPGARTPGGSPRAASRAAARSSARPPVPSGPWDRVRQGISRHPKRSLALGAVTLALVGTWFFWPGTRRVVAGDFQAFQPRWSPRGERFAFLVEDGGDLRLAVYDEGADTHRFLGAISGWGEQSFDWSPDGLRLAYVVPPDDDGWQESIAVADVLSGVSTRVTTGSAPLWFADTTTLLAQCSAESLSYAARREGDWTPGLCRIDIATGASQRVGDLPSWRLSYSPTLDMIAFESFEAEGREVAGSDADEKFQGLVDAVVSDDPNNVLRGSRNLSRELEARGYMDERDGGGGGEPSFGTDVFVRDVSGRRATRLTGDHRSALVSWTPDGLRILYAISGGPDDGLWAVDPDGGNRRAILAPPPEIAAPHQVAVSADGERVFFVSPVEANPGLAKIMTGEEPADLYVARTGSSSVERLVNQHPFKQRFAVCPEGRHIVYEVLADTGGLRGGGRSELWLMSR